MNTTDLQLDNLTFKEQQSQITEFLGQQKKDQKIQHLKERAELQKKKAQEVFLIQKNMRTGEPKHKQQFNLGAKKVEYFNKPGLLPFPSEVAQISKSLGKTQAKSKIRASRLKSALSKEIKFASNIKSVKFIEGQEDYIPNINIEYTDKQYIYSERTVPQSVEQNQESGIKPSLLGISKTQPSKRQVQSAWLPTASIPRLFKEEKPLSPRLITSQKLDPFFKPTQRSTSPILIPEVQKKDWLPTKSRPQSSFALQPLHILQQSQQVHPFVALKNQLLQETTEKNNTSDANKGEQPIKFRRIEAFKPGKGVGDVFPQPKVVKSKSPFKAHDIRGAEFETSQ